MKYCCTSCSYVYDEATPEIDCGIVPGTKLDILGDNFCCPVCSDGIDSFEPIKEEINYFNDETNLDPIELEHFPEYKIENDILYVWVGKSQHPMGVDHYISSIMLYDEYGDLIFEEFLVPESESEADFDISEFDDFEIRIRCTLHGVWGRKCNRE